jgi:hypothetical protein
MGVYSGRPLNGLCLDYSCLDRQFKPIRRAINYQTIYRTGT